MAIICNASDIHLQCNSASGFGSSLGSFSISTWINAVWNPGSRRSLVGMYGPTSPTTAIQIGTTAGGGELSCWTWGGAVLVGTAAGVMTPYNNIWVHICYTFDGSTHQLYLNGSQLITSTTAQTAGTFNWVYINGYPTGVTNEVHNHQVDNYIFYNRTLSAAEVMTIYSCRGSRHGIDDSVLARYEFGDLAQGSTISTVKDLSGLGNDLVLAGAGTAMTYTYSNTVASSNLRPVQ